MDIQIKDVITLSDQNQYVIVSKINYQSEIYFYIVDMNNHENMKFLKLKEETQTLIEIKDEPYIQGLLPLFLKETSKHLSEEEMDAIIENI